MPTESNESHEPTQAEVKGSFHRLETEAHVWLARPSEICDAGLLGRYRDILSVDERARQDRFRTPELRHLFLVAHGLVRTSLSRYAEFPPEVWEFSEGEHGRPEISGPTGFPPLRFNLSHSVGLVACLVCREIDCGVDVERVGRVQDLAGVSCRVLSGRELADLNSRSGDSKPGRFTDFWVLKEAYIKARGMGFQLPLRDITFGIATSGEISLEFAPGFDDDARDWQLMLSTIEEPGQEFRLGVALRRAEGPARKVIVRDIVPVC